MKAIALFFLVGTFIVATFAQHVIEVPKSLEEFDEQQQQQQENRAEISENHENKVDNSENEGSRESPTDSLDEKSYLVEYLHSMGKMSKDQLSSKTVPQLVDLIIESVQNRLQEEKDPEQRDLIEKHIQYFQNMKNKH